RLPCSNGGSPPTRISCAPLVDFCGGRGEEGRALLCIARVGVGSGCRCNRSRRGRRDHRPGRRRRTGRSQSGTCPRCRTRDQGEAGRAPLVRHGWNRWKYGSGGCDRRWGHDDEGAGAGTRSGRLPAGEQLLRVYASRVSFELLGRLHLARPEEYATRRDIAEALRRSPLPKRRTKVTDSLFRGPLVFAQVSFRTRTGTVTVASADFNTAMAYARLAV